MLSILSVPIGLEVGFSSAGAGALGSVLLFNFTTLPPVSVIGTDLLFGLVISAAGGGVHAISGACDWPVIGAMVPAGIVGTVVGARLARSIPSRYLKIGVLAWAGLLGLMLLRRGISGS